MPLVIRSWPEVFENNRSREIRYPQWVPIPNDLSSLGLRRIAAETDGAMIFGAFILMVEVGSHCQPRGWLQTSGGHPYDAEMLAAKTGFPPDVFRRSIEVCTRIGWLETRISPQQGAVIPQEGATIPQHDAGIPHRKGREEKGKERKRTPASAGLSDTDTGPETAPVPAAKQGRSDADTGPETAPVGGAESGPVPDPKRRHNQKTQIRRPKNQNVVFPENLDTPEFRATWERWVAYRSEIRHTLTPSTIQRQLTRFQRWGSAYSIQAIDRSIENGWTGLFELPESEAPETLAPEHTTVSEAEQKRIDALTAAYKAKMFGHLRGQNRGATDAD